MNFREKKGTLNVVISGEEILHTHFGVDLFRKVQKAFPNSRFRFQTRSEAAAIQQVQDGEAHFALMTGDVPNGLKAKTLAKVEFKTCASKEHALFNKYSASSKIPVEELLKHSFITPEVAMLGRVTTSASLDGWRDDKFPRQIKYRTSSLKLMDRVLNEGHAIAYLPDYYVKELGLYSLNITGCPYSCHQTIKIVCKDPESLSWLNRVWSSI